MIAEVDVPTVRKRVTKLEARKALNKITVKHRKEKIGDTRFEFYEEADNGNLIYTEIDNGVRRGRVVVGRAMGAVRIVSGFVFTPEMLLEENPELKIIKKKEKKSRGRIKNSCQNNSTTNGGAKHNKSKNLRKDDRKLRSAKRRRDSKSTLSTKAKR